MTTRNKHATTEVCAYCRLRADEANPKRCGLRKVRPGTDPHRFETIEMDPRIHRIAFDLSLATGCGFKGNFWHGADLGGTNLRLITDDWQEEVELLVFDSDAFNVCSYKIRFSADTPTSVILATVSAI